MFCTHLRQSTSGCRWAQRLPSGSRCSGWHRCVRDMQGPNGLNDARSTSPRPHVLVAAVGLQGILSEASSSLSPQRSDAKYFEHM